MVGSALGGKLFAGFLRENGPLAQLVGAKGSCGRLSGSAFGVEFPEEGAEFPRHGGHDLVLVEAAGAHAVVLAAQSLLGAP